MQCEATRLAWVCGPYATFQTNSNLNIFLSSHLKKRDRTFLEVGAALAKSIYILMSCLFSDSDYEVMVRY